MFPNPDHLPLTETNIGHGIVISTKDPDHGRKVMSVLGALSQGATKPVKRRTPAEQYERDLADFGEAFCRAKAGLHFGAYPREVSARLLSDAFEHASEAASAQARAA